MSKLVNELPDMDTGEIEAVFLCQECWNEIKDHDVVEEIAANNFYPSPHHDEHALLMSFDDPKQQA